MRDHATYPSTFCDISVRRWPWADSFLRVQMDSDQTMDCNKVCCSLRRMNCKAAVLLPSALALFWCKWRSRARHSSTNERSSGREGERERERESHSFHLMADVTEGRVARSGLVGRWMGFARCDFFIGPPSLVPSPAGSGGAGRQGTDSMKNHLNFQLRFSTLRKS